MKKPTFVILVVSLIFVAQAGAVKIACVGNSITAYQGTYPGNIDPNSYPLQLQIVMGDGYEIQNFGVSGCTLLKHGNLPIWDEAAFSDALAFQPDIVTILLGTNDSKPVNWVYKDEFVSDYTAMVDTFLSLGSNPQIYACLPPPAFSSKYDITDSIIVNDIVPMIQQVAGEKSLPTIDFYSFFLDKPQLSYDGIHPNTDGLWEYTKMFYQTLTGDTIEEIQEVNLVLNKTVTTSIASDTSDHLVDGNDRTVWFCDESVIITIDLDSVVSTDMFQILLRAPVPFGYTIETSEDSVTWTTAVDVSENPDTSQTVIEGTDPINARWVRFTVNPTDLPIRIAELRVLETAPIHAPLIVYSVNRFTTGKIWFDMRIVSSIKGGALKYVYKGSTDESYIASNGYRKQDEVVIPFSLQKGQERSYIAKFYKDNYEVGSDTVMFDYSLSTAVQGTASFMPGRFALNQNYPNPFNPSTTIRYHLEKAGKVRIAVYDCLGKEVGILADGFQRVGDHSVEFRSGHFSSGVYFYMLEAGGLKIAKKMLLIK